VLSAMSHQTQTMESLNIAHNRKAARRLLRVKKEISPTVFAIRRRTS
jgi:hypothetical protein